MKRLILMLLPAVLILLSWWAITVGEAHGAEPEMEGPLAPEVVGRLLTQDEYVAEAQSDGVLALDLQPEPKPIVYPCHDADGKGFTPEDANWINRQEHRDEAHPAIRCDQMAWQDWAVEGSMISGVVGFGAVLSNAYNTNGQIHDPNNLLLNMEVGFALGATAAGAAKLDDLIGDSYTDEDGIVSRHPRANVWPRDRDLYLRSLIVVGGWETLMEALTISAGEHKNANVVLQQMAAGMAGAALGASFGVDLVPAGRKGAPSLVVVAAALP